MSNKIEITNVETRGEQDPLDNPARGCGHLERGKCYLRGGGVGPRWSSEWGILPSWVRADPPIPFREVGTEGSFTRGYRTIDGLSMQLALTEFEHHHARQPAGRHRFKPQSPGDNYAQFAPRNLVRADVYEEPSHISNTEVERHIDRLRLRGPEDGSHWGDIPICGQSDLLMRAGKTYYPAPEDYHEEAKRHGVSKAIPIGPGQEPPDVVPGISRLWIMHPVAGPDDYGGAIIGYCYLNEAVFTEPADGELPEYIENMRDDGKLNVADIAPPEEPEDEDDDEDDQVGLSGFREGDGPAESDESDESDSQADADAAESVQPSDQEGRDVEAADGAESADTDDAANEGGGGE